MNQTEDVYNGLGQLTGEYQSVSGAVVIGTTPEVQYVYTEMSGGQNNSRLTQMIYPNGRKIDYVYNSGLDKSISRLSAIKDDSSGTVLEGYLYLGLDTIVEWDHPQTGVNLSYIKQTGDTKFINDGGDQYVGLDRFGRVIDQNWWDPTTQTSTDRFQYGYDRVGDVLFQNNLVNTSESVLFHANSTQSGDNNTAYDALGRQTGFARGTLSASGHNGTSLDSVSSPSQTQSWSLDALGNWSSQTNNSNTTTRTFTAQNETKTVSGGTAPTYNNNGDTTGDNGLTYVYNAWDELVTVKNGSTIVASYTYDALGRRITETYGSTTNNLYYSPSWQVIEERQNGTGTSNVTYQFVWGAGYIDQMVLRDTYASGVETQRLYASYDANYDMTSIVNTSGAVVERYIYDPYGNITVLTSTWGTVSGNQSQYGWRYLYQGGRFDTTTSWYDFRNRDYIPVEGRWAERDPLGFGGGTDNLYQALGGSPAGATDSMGLREDGDDPFAGMSKEDIERLWLMEGARQAEEERMLRGGSTQTAPETDPPPSTSGRNFVLFNDDYTASVEENWDALTEYLDENAAYIDGTLRVGGAIAEGSGAVGATIAGNPVVGATLGALAVDNLQVAAREFWTGEVKRSALNQGIDGAAETVLDPEDAQGVADLGEIAVHGYFGMKGGGAAAELEQEAECLASRNSGRVLPKSCFPAGTPVATSEGLRPIEAICAGDNVWAYDLVASGWRLCHVSRPYNLRIEKGTSVFTTVAGETIESTYRHPYWVVQGEALACRPCMEHLAEVPPNATTPGRWVDSCNLRVGDELLLRDGRISPVERIEYRPFEGVVYNLEVENLHCYTVGRSSVLVHNNNGPETPPSGAAPNNPSKSYSGRYADGEKAFRTNVPRDAYNDPVPDPEAIGPHTRLQRDAGNSGRIYSGTEFDANGVPIKRVDLAGRRGDTIPHEHPYDPNTKTFGPKVPLR